MNLSNRILKIAAVYFMGGAMLGLIMGMTQDFREVPVHAHLNLLGWASLALIGLLYRVHPALAETGLAKAHFWLHNLGMPVAMAGLFFALRGDSRAMPVVGIGSVTIVIGIACFVANVMRSLPREQRAETMAATTAGNLPRRV